MGAAEVIGIVLGSNVITALLSLFANRNLRKADEKKRAVETCDIATDVYRDLIDDLKREIDRLKRVCEEQEKIIKEQHSLIKRLKADIQKIEKRIKDEAETAEI